MRPSTSSFAPTCASSSCEHLLHTSKVEIIRADVRLPSAKAKATKENVVFVLKVLDGNESYGVERSWADFIDLKNNLLIALDPGHPCNGVCPWLWEDLRHNFDFPTKKVGFLTWWDIRFQRHNATTIEIFREHFQQMLDALLKLLCQPPDHCERFHSVFAVVAGFLTPDAKEALQHNVVVSIQLKMAGKRKATTSTPAPSKRVTRASRSKKVVEEVIEEVPKIEEEPDTEIDVPVAVKDEPQYQRKLDEHYTRFYGSAATVIGNYDVMLNQVEIKATTSKNKFYRIQLIQLGFGGYDVWTRWGRVGENGDCSLLSKGQLFTLEQATKAFEKKFKDKTKNTWGSPFKPKKGSYEIIELDAKACSSEAAEQKTTIGNEFEPSTLPVQTQNLIRMIFDRNMFKDAMATMNLDPARMPLGTLSATQIAKGVTILDRLQADISQNKTSNLATLSSKFYQLIPHAFSRSTIPPVIRTPELLEEKYAMLSTLHDIVVAQDVEKKLTAAPQTLQANPVDLKYQELNADMELVDKSSEIYSTLVKYINITQGIEGHGTLQLQDIWAVRRSPEDTSFSKFSSVPDHRLLWHGTNVAVVAAILKTGLRIMPSAGGRVGRGIYLANMLEKSRQYLHPCNFDGQRLGCVFLVEAALGKIHQITQDDSSLTQAPTGFDSVLAKGTVHPAIAANKTIELDGNQVTVSSGKREESGVSSSFYHDEFLVYKETQQRLRVEVIDTIVRLPRVNTKPRRNHVNFIIQIQSDAKCRTVEQNWSAFMKLKHDLLNALDLDHYCTGNCSQLYEKLYHQKIFGSTLFDIKTWFFLHLDYPTSTSIQYTQKYFEAELKYIVSLLHNYKSSCKKYQDICNKFKKEM
ncbi:poly, ADP-ribose polymerase 3-like [Thraustotheca clavata]|uniref:Poly [ADP-ribose] polymerase n=1 Tax=Thraustotheca clavata TaxID=74557 RepID=A0A1W0A449_9STRA|nr:poly, ADP-ribose polymerase 3-like [Thraustotheca clavata]